MDYEVELNYRLTGHLDSNETVLATLVSIQHGIYAATDQRILCLNNDTIGYRLRVHPYECLERVDCLSEDDAWFVQFVSGERVLMVRARTEREARNFADAASDVLADQHGVGVEQTS